MFRQDQAGFRLGSRDRYSLGFREELRVEFGQGLGRVLASFREEFGLVYRQGSGSVWGRVREGV